MAESKYHRVDLATNELGPVHEARPNNIWGRMRGAGWRAGVFYAGVAIAVVFLINLCVTIWALTQGSEHGHALLYEGSCSTTTRLNTGIHFIINAFGSIMLAGTNYAMQCLSSPTRQEIDLAHAQNRWLDIGVPSVRNLKHISRQRKWLWFVLGLSSIPLHLL